MCLKNIEQYPKEPNEFLHVSRAHGLRGFTCHKRETPGQESKENLPGLELPGS